MGSGAQPLSFKNWRHPVSGLGGMIQDDFADRVPAAVILSDEIPVQGDEFALGAASGFSPSHEQVGHSPFQQMAPSIGQGLDDAFGFLLGMDEPPLSLLRKTNPPSLGLGNTLSKASVHLESDRNYSREILRSFLVF